MDRKQQVRELLDRLPEAVTYAEIIDAVDLLDAIEESEADIAAGRVIPHEQVMKELHDKWIPIPPSDTK